MATGKERMQIPPPPERADPQFAFNQCGDNMARFDWSPDGRTLAVGGFSERGKIQLWEVATKKIGREFMGHDG
jgi:WD40 repeat protein